MNLWGKKKDQDESIPAEEYGLRFEPEVQENKLFIRVYDERNVFKYSGYIDISPNMKLNLLLKSLKERDFTIEKINPYELSINIGVINIEFTSVERQEEIEFEERLRKLEENQCKYKKIIAKKEKKSQKQERKIEEQEKRIAEQEKKIAEQEKRIKKFEELEKTMEKIKETVGENKDSIKRINTQINIISPFPRGFSHLNEPIKSSKWSTQLKSSQITIYGKIVRLKKETDYRQFCLLNASFSNTLTQKQSWTIKINKNTDWIELGFCLKSKMINYNFNDENINWDQTTHGLYLIGSDGDFFSHSKKGINSVFKSFEFGEGDIIDVEYDPMDKKLRFSKNKTDGYFEMPIIAPPENDAYHPCVELCEENSSVELLSPEN